MVTSIPDIRFQIEQVAGRMPELVRWRLINGELFMMSPAGGRHGMICSNITLLLHLYAKSSKKGVSFGAETGYVLTRDPDTLLAPDASFITADRADAITDKFFDGPPDLAVEVISPSQTVPNATEKAEQWLDLGAQVVWLVWPRTKTVTEYLPKTDSRDYKVGESITGISFMPGFECPIEEVFA